MTYAHLLWISDVCTETGSLLFWWEGSCGAQPVLMPGHIFYWWLESPEGSEHGSGSQRLH